MAKAVPFDIWRTHVHQIRDQVSILSCNFSPVVKWLTFGDVRASSRHMYCYVHD